MPFRQGQHGDRYPSSRSTSVQRRDKNDLVVWLERVGPFSLEFPIRIIDKDEYSWPAVGEVS